MKTPVYAEHCDNGHGAAFRESRCRGELITETALNIKSADKLVQKFVPWLQQVLRQSKLPSNHENLASSNVIERPFEIRGKPTKIMVCLGHGLDLCL